MTPDTGLRHRVLLGAMLGNMVGLVPAVAAIFGLFLMPLADEFGWSRAAISGVLGLISIGPALVAPFVGRLADRIGTRPILIGGNLGLSGSIALLAFTTNSLLQFYATFTLVAVSAAFVSTPVLAKIVSDWYAKNRGVALGFAAGFGNGIGSALLPAIAAVAMAATNWRGAYLSVAATVLLIGLPAYLLLIRDVPRHVANAVADTRMHEGVPLRVASRDQGFWIVVVAIAAAAGALTAIFSHMVPILHERGVGIGPATMLLGIFAMATAAWQILSGFLLDRTATPRIIVPMYLASVIGIVLMQRAEGMPLQIVAALLLAIALGTQFSALPYILGRYFGLRHFGSIMGAAYAAVFVFQGLVPVILDYSFDVQGTYEGALLGLAACLAVGGAALLYLPRYRYDIDNAPDLHIHA